MGPTLDEMAARAQRHLDGMTVNRDAMARDVLTLVEAIRSAQRRAPARPAQPGSNFSDAFGDIFDTILNRRHGA
jgi:hypothetical protein